MLEWAINQKQTPVVVKTPTGAVVNRAGDFSVDYASVGYETVRDGEDVALIAAGDFLPLALDAAKAVAARGLNPKVINPRYVSKIDPAALDALAGFRKVITLEDNSVDGGMGQKIAAYLSELPVKVKVMGLPKEFVDRFNAGELLRKQGLTPEALAEIIEKP